MIINDTNLDIWYNDYLKKFKNTKAYIERKGGTVRTSKPMSRGDFAIDFRSMVYDNPKMYGKQIAEEMATQDLYMVSKQQAKNYAAAEYRATGNKSALSINVITEYRLGIRTDLFDSVKIVRADMKRQGFSNDAIVLFIGQEFFGSP